MKNFLRHPLWFFSLIISGLAVIAISFYSFSFALEVDPDQGLEEMENPVVLGELRQDIMAPACLDNYEDWAHSNEYTGENNWSLGFLPFEYWHVQQMEGGAVRPSFDSPHPRREQFIDFNGDGLLDYFYAFRKGNVKYRPTNQGVYVLDTDYREIQECVLLNNGHGWDLVYKCYGNINLENNSGEFYGDCALIEEDE